MTLKLPLYEVGDYFVLKAAKGYEVYRNGAVAATRCAIIGYEGGEGLRRAIAEADRRAKLPPSLPPS